MFLNIEEYFCAYWAAVNLRIKEGAYVWIQPFRYRNTKWKERNASEPQ
jgi:hypothetical protein